SHPFHSCVGRADLCVHTQIWANVETVVSVCKIKAHQHDHTHTETCCTSLAEEPSRTALFTRASRCPRSRPPRCGGIPSIRGRSYFRRYRCFPGSVWFLIYWHAVTRSCRIWWSYRSTEILWSFSATDTCSSGCRRGCNIGCWAVGVAGDPA